MRKICLLLLLTSTAFADSLQSIQKEAAAFAKQLALQAPHEMKKIDAKDLVPEEMRNQTFNPEEAKENTLSNTSSSSSIVDFLTSQEVQSNRQKIDTDDYLFKNSEEIADQAGIGEFISPESLESTIETCQEADFPYPFSLIRDLQVHVIHHPEEIGTVKVCTRHEYKKNFQWKKEAERQVKKLRDSLSKDSTVKWFHVQDPKEGGLLHRYVVQAHWEHHDNTEICDRYESHIKVVKPAWLEETGDEWIFEDLSQATYFKNPDCTLFEKICLDATPSKTISGKEVQRQCWKEKYTFLCALKSNLDCLSLKEKNCEFLQKTCLLEGPLGCSLWELAYRCHSKIHKRKLGKDDFFGKDENLWEIDYDPNTSFSDVAMKLSVFEAMQKDIQNSTASDPGKIQVFAGKALTCSKNIADEILYDCCFSYSGVAKELGLAKCTADEIALAEMRERGLCHYVGSYSKKFYDLWKSRDEHVFCCFSSKLARVFQEQARQQLSLGWGEPKQANPRGLTIDEISSLDFTKLDLREAFSDLESQMSVRIQDKLEEFQKKVQQKIEKTPTLSNVGQIPEPNVINVNLS